MPTPSKKANPFEAYLAARKSDAVFASCEADFTLILAQTRRDPAEIFRARLLVGAEPVKLPPNLANLDRRPPRSLIS